MAKAFGPMAQTRAGQEPNLCGCKLIAPMMHRALLAAAATFSMVAHAQNFTLHSTDLGGQADMRQVYNGFGCTGGNLSPELSWSGAPAGTKSFALTLFDPDAPTGSGWWHWVVFDLPAGVHELATGAGAADGSGLPAGAVQGITDFGVPGYGGPCPPTGGGAHRYVLTVYALKVAKLGLDSKALPASVSFMMGQQTLAKASIVFYYQR